MRYTFVILAFLMAVPGYVFSQYLTDEPHPTSKYYKEMFPANIDEVKLLVLLPKKLPQNIVDSLLKNQSEIDANRIYENHLQTTEETIKLIPELVKKYNINCEIIKKEDYNTSSFPVAQYPLLVYPDSMLVNRYFVTFGYHIQDVQNSKKYGYAKGSDPDIHENYFKQLAKYSKDIKKKKERLLSNLDSSKATASDTLAIAPKAEQKIYARQKNSKILLQYVALPLAFVVAIGVAVLAITF